jgi:hypothetical protein
MRIIQADMLQHSSNRTLATMTIFTMGKTPDEICTEIVRQLAGG